MKKRANERANKKTNNRRRSRSGVPATSLAPDPTLAGGFQNLAQAIARGMVKPGRLTHTDCEALLEYYVDSENRGESAADLYPAVAGHLDECPTCHNSYALYREMFGPPAASTAELAQTARELTFPLPVADTAAWSGRVYSPLGGALGFGFIIQGPYLRQKLSPGLPAPGLRSEESGRRRALVLAESLTVAHWQVAVQVWALHLPEPDHLRIQVLLASSAPLPGPLSVRLLWNDTTISAPIQKDEAIFDDIPASELEDASNLSIDFVVSHQDAVT